MAGTTTHSLVPAGLSPLAPTKIAPLRVDSRFMAEEMRPETAFGLQGAYENIWHIARAERWSDGQLIGHRTYCGRN